MTVYRLSLNATHPKPLVHCPLGGIYNETKFTNHKCHIVHFASFTNRKTENYRIRCNKRTGYLFNTRKL